jgi:SAM-dependent methyltransferase
MLPASVLEANVAHWSAYWATTGTDGCTSAFPPKVAAALAAGWRQLLGALPADSSLIDIACGKGAVLALARARGLSCLTGVDIAAIPAADPAIRGGIDAARLPFGDASFDVAVSQFGVEYAGLAAAVGEAGRVARRHVWLLLHAADGPVVAAAREVAAHSHWLEGEVQAFARMARHAQAPGAGSTTDLAALQAAIADRAGAAANTSLLEAVWQAAGAQREAPDVAAVRHLEAEVAAWVERLQLLTGAAPGAAEAAAAADQLRAAGWQVSLQGEGAPPAARWLLASR